MSIYEEFMNFLQKEFGIEKGPFKFPKTKILSKPRKLMDWANTKAAQHRTQWETEPPKIVKEDKNKPWPKGAWAQGARPGGGSGVKVSPIAKGGVGSGRKASSSSKLATPKRGSPIKVAISRYQKKPSPSLHQKVVEAFRGKERKKTKIEDPLKGLKHPWD